MEKMWRLLPERCCRQELIEMDAEFDTPREVLAVALLLLCAAVVVCLMVAGLVWAGLKIFI